MTLDEAAAQYRGTVLAAFQNVADTLHAFQAYLDIEMEKGAGVSKAEGLGGYVNGDAIRAGSANLGNGPYVARAYLRYFHALSTETEKAERGGKQSRGARRICKRRRHQGWLREPRE